MKYSTTKKIFITGTDTAVGKTTLTCALLYTFTNCGLVCHGFKPIASGCTSSDDGLRNNDALLIQQYASESLPYEAINPYAFAQPIAPHIAANKTNTVIDTTLLAQHIQQPRTCDVLLIEGVGGWQVPLNMTINMSDFVAQNKLDVILVVGMKLGCLNHAFLTQAAIEAKNCRLLGWISNALDPNMLALQENIATLKKLMTSPHLAHIPYEPTQNIPTIAKHIPTDLMTLMYPDTICDT